MNEKTRQLALEKKKAISMERRQKALSLLEKGMTRREIAKILGVSKGSVNAYCNGYKSPAGISKPIDIGNPDISKPIIDTKKIEEKCYGLLKELISTFIQESVEKILREIPIQDIIETETIKVLKNANVGFSTNSNKAAKVKSKKKNPVIIAEEKPMIGSPIEENHDPIVGEPTEENPTITITDLPLSHQESETKTILMILPQKPMLNLGNKAISF
jgi:predicted transcriptional regulator